MRGPLFAHSLYDRKRSSLALSDGLVVVIH
jgi:hypothetical protein